MGLGRVSAMHLRERSMPDGIRPFFAALALPRAAFFCVDLRVHSPTQKRSAGVSRSDRTRRARTQSGAFPDPKKSDATEGKKVGFGVKNGETAHRGWGIHHHAFGEGNAEFFGVA